MVRCPKSRCNVRQLGRASGISFRRSISSVAWDNVIRLTPGTMKRKARIAAVKSPLNLMEAFLPNLVSIRVTCTSLSAAQEPHL